MKPDFSGDYVLNRSASALDGPASSMTGARMRFAHDEPRFCCSARFEAPDGPIEFNFERCTDGRVATVSEHETSRCYWDADALVSEDRFGSGDGAVVMSWRYELVGDNRDLRATERIRGGGRDQDNVWEFERQ
jgi:hypothetical protein